MNRTRWFWTDEMTEWVREHQEGKVSFEILPEFNEHFGLNLKQHNFQIVANKHGIRFGRGHPWKHLKESPLKGKKTGPYPKERCEKAAKNQTKYKVGETIGWKSHGIYELVKVSDAPGEKKYMRKNRWIYEQAYGSVPDGYDVVFLDGDPTNYDLDNLRAVPKGAMSFRRKFEKQTDPEAAKARVLMAELEYWTERLGKKEEK